MTEKEKKVFKLMISYMNKVGCDIAEIEGEFWSDELFSGRYFSCKNGTNNKFPFDPSDVLNNWVDNLDLGIRHYEDEGMNSIFLQINPKDNSVSIIGTFSEIETGEEHTKTIKLSDNLDLERLKKSLGEKYGEFKNLEVRFTGYGDSGGLENVRVDGRDYNSDNLPSDLEDILYGMLQDFPGWEIDSGSDGSFEVDLINDKVVLYFNWNEQVDRPETIYRGEIED